MTDLLPCPFCGSVPTLTSDRYLLGQMGSEIGWFVQCACGVRTKEEVQYGQMAEECQEKVAAIWNRRTAPHRSASQENT